MAEVLFRAKLTREEANVPWGFRLQGGVEYDKPLTLLKVVADSLAAKGGLHPGDIVVKLAGHSGNNMTHKDAQEAIISAGNALEIIVERAEVTITTQAEVTNEAVSLTTGTTQNTPTTNVTSETTDSSSQENSQDNKKNQVTEKVTNQTSNSENIENVTVNSLPSDSEEEIDETNKNTNNNNIKESVSLEKPADAPVKNHMPDEEEPRKIVNKEEINKDDTIPNDVRHKKDMQNLVPDNNVRKEKGIEGLPTAKHKLPDKTDMTQSDSSDTVRQVDIQPSKQNCDIAEKKNTESMVTKRKVEKKHEDDPKSATEKQDKAVKQHCDPSVAAISENGNSSKSTELLQSANAQKSSVGNCDTCRANDTKAMKNIPNSETLTALTPESKGHNSIVTPSDKESLLVQTKVEKKEADKITKKPSVQDPKSTEELDAKSNNNDAKLSKVKSAAATIDNKSQDQKQTDNSKGKPREKCTANKSAEMVSSTSSDADKTKCTANKSAEVVSSTSSSNADKTESTGNKSTEVVSSDSSNADKTPSPSVIKEFQPPSTTKSTSPKPSSSYVPSVPKPWPKPTVSLASLNSASLKQTKASDNTAKSPHIPESSSSKSPLQTIGMVITEVPKVTINATAKRPGEKKTIPSEGSSVQNTPKSSTMAPKDESASQETKAPSEEIIITSKASVQIVTPVDTIDSKQSSDGVSHEVKDFSKTAPWRVHKQGTTHDHSVLHPWRKSRTENIMSQSLDDRQLSETASRMSQVTGIANKTPPTVTSNSITQAKSDALQRTKSDIDLSSSKPQPSLTYVGKRIESPPVGSPVGMGAPFFKPGYSAGKDAPPSVRSNTIPVPSMCEPNSMPIPSPTNDVISSTPETMKVQVAAPDLVDIPMPAVKNMVENLNKRLEAIAVQHPKIVEPTTTQELGLNYFKRSDGEIVASPYHQIIHDYGDREIIINTPPNPNITAPVLEDIKQQLLAAGAGYQQVYQLLEPLTSPASHRRRFSLPGGSVAPRHNQRRVRFAEPVESSVIEIEPTPRKQKLLERLERRRYLEDEGSMSDMEDYSYSSASSLDAKLDRIERENALSNASFQRNRNAKHRAQNLSGDIAQTKPAESFRDKVVNFESLEKPKRDNVVLSSLKPYPKDIVLGQGRSGPRGFSLSIGQNKPGSISLSLTQRGTGQPVSQVALAVPPTEGHFSYTISPKTGSPEPYSIRYTVPSHVVTEPVQIIGGEHAKSHSLDSAKTIHIQYPPPPEGVPTIQTQLLNTSPTSPLSPPPQVIRQLAGRPGIRTPTSYSNTLQIDTSSKLQHRSPSPPHLSLSPSMPPDRTRLSPQRLVPPLSRLHDVTSLDHQRSSSPIQGAPVAQPMGFKVRQPSPTNPMAYQRSTSPQGHPQYGPQPGYQHLSRQGGSSPIPYQQVAGPHASVTLHSSSPRNVSPVGFQHQHVQLIPGSSVGYQRSPSPQGQVSLPLPQSSPYAAGGMMQRAPKNLHPQQVLQPPGYSFQPSQFQQPGPRFAPRMPVPQRMMTEVPRGPPAVALGSPRAPVVRDISIRGAAAAAMPGIPSIAGMPSVDMMQGVPGDRPGSPSSAPQGVFALFDKKFMGKFLQWTDEGPGGLYESETYKLVHQMDEEGEDP